MAPLTEMLGAHSFNMITPNRMVNVFEVLHAASSPCPKCYTRYVAPINNPSQAYLGTDDDDVHHGNQHQTTLSPQNTFGRALQAHSGPFYAMNHTTLSITYPRPELWW